MTARFLVEVLMVLVGGYAIKRWADRKLPPGGGHGDGSVSPTPAGPARDALRDPLSPQQLAELSPKERAFVLDVLRGLERRGGNAEGVNGSRFPDAPSHEPAADRTSRTPVSLGPAPGPDAVLPSRLYCPACSAPLAEAGRKLAEVTACHGCGRPLLVRVEEGRLVVSMALEGEVGPG